MRSFGIVLAAGLVAWTADVQAGLRHCGHCGCERDCNKVCRVECGTKKETKIEYSCECEDFCVPGRSRKCGVTCECDDHGCKTHRTVWQPTCGKVRTRKNLVKKEVSKEVPDYKWVVEEICSGCGQCACRTEHTRCPSQACLADDSEIRPVSATDEIVNDSAIVLANDQIAVEPGFDDADVDFDEAAPAADEAPRARPRRPSRFLHVLLGGK